jgi:hypothetical protein
MNLLPLRRAIFTGAVAMGCTGTIGDAGKAGSENRPPGEIPASVAAAGPPTRIGVRRLSRIELERSLHRLFGADMPVDTNVLPADTLTPFDNDVLEQSPSMLLIESLETIARGAATWITATPERMARIVPCKPAAPDDAVCFTQFVNKLGERVLRRPLDDEDRKGLVDLIAYGKSTGDFGEAVRMAVRVLLMQPDFIYRVEIGIAKVGTQIRLSPFELATRLAFLLQGQTPDDALLARAKSGGLDTDEGLQQALTELLASPEAREQTRRFHAFWLGYATLESSPLQKKLRTETDALVDRATEPGRDFRYLLLADETFVDSELATHYGLTGSGWVKYGSAPRIGILSHGAFAAAGAKFGDTSPTRRGKFIRERMLCEPIALPPPDVSVDVDQPPASKTPGACKKARYEEHRSNPVCAGCHSRVDPIGFGLENFDKDGKYRTHDDDNPECAIDGVGELNKGQTFTGAKGLAPLIAGNAQFVACFSEHFVRFAVGRSLDTTDGARVTWLASEMSNKSNSFEGLVRAYVMHPNFRVREEE